jgi:hypothetical protein
MLGPVVGCGSNADLPIDPPAPPPACDVGELAIHGCEQRCPAGEIELDGVCQPAGVVEGQCAEGFVYDGDHGCEPVGAPICGPGTLAVPGEEACHPVVACTGTWGAAPLAANTVYVQAGAIGGGGSQAMPFASVQQGIDAATNGAVIAIAAGSYAEDVAIGKAVQLWGACPEQTTIVGTGTEIAAVYVQSGAAGAQLHDLGVSGAGIGVLVAGAIDVVIDQLWIHDTARRGIDAETVFGTTSVSVTRTLVENAGGWAFFRWERAPSSRRRSCAERRRRWMPRAASTCRSIRRAACRRR